MTVCPNCKTDGLEYQEGVRGGYLYDPNREIPHHCRHKEPRQPKKYWCSACGVGIPIVNPCVHKRLKEKGLFAYE